MEQWYNDKQYQLQSSLINVVNMEGTPCDTCSASIGADLIHVHRNSRIYVHHESERRTVFEISILNIVIVPTLIVLSRVTRLEAPF